MKVIQIPRRGAVRLDIARGVVYGETRELGETTAPGELARELDETA